MVQKKSKTRLIAERRRTVQAELQELEAKIVSLKQELGALDAAEELLARLARLAGESDDEDEENGVRRGTTSYSGAGDRSFENANANSTGPRMRLREMAEIIISERAETGITTRELLDTIRRRWQFDLDPNHLRPLAWRMVKEGRWTKDHDGHLRLLDLSVKEPEIDEN